MGTDGTLRILLPLVRCALWNTPATAGVLSIVADFDESDWQRLCREASRQSVSGLLYAALDMLPEEVIVPESILFYTMTEAERISSGSRRIMEVQEALLKKFRAYGLRPTVIKGTTCAQRYPRPLLRGGGDIDLYIPPETWGRLAEVASLEGWTLERSSDGSHHLIIDGIDVDMHPSYFDLHVPAAKLPPVPSLEAELLMLSAHIFKHASTSGVGLRPLCDFALAWRQYTGDRKALEAYFKAAGMARWNMLLLSFLNDWMGLEDASARVSSDILMRTIGQGGHLGQYGTGRGAALLSRRFFRKADTFFRMLRRLPFAMRYAPKEALSYMSELVRGNLN